MSGILVVGAGPVGLTMAAELARHGAPVRIIDKRPAPSPYCRAIGVTPRTLEVWEDMGVVREAIDAGIWLDGLRMIIDGKVVSDSRPDLSDLPYAQLGLPQYETERVLTRHLMRFGVRPERGVELVSLTQDDRAAAATLRHLDGTVEHATFDYVIGCDGAHSTVRHAAGIGFPGEAMPFDFMLADVHIDWSVPRGIAVFCLNPKQDTAPDMFIAVPLPERSRYRVSMLADEMSPPQGDNEHGIQLERAPPPLSAIQAVATRLVPEPAELSDMRWSSLFRISMRLAETYRNGRLLLAGDAAHIHPPTGGQGMNTGIQDAYNLAWKLALVVRGEAGPALLDSYDEERRPVGEDVIRRTSEASMSLGRSHGPTDRLADMQLLVSYRESSWARDDTASAPGSALSGSAAGDRAPDVWELERHGVGSPLRLFDLLRGTSHVLLVWLDDPEAGSQLETFVGALKQDHGERIRVVVIVPAGLEIDTVLGAALISDAAGTYSRTYGSSAYLIRPDNYIGWKGRDWTEHGLTELLSRVFSSQASE